MIELGNQWYVNLKTKELYKEVSILGGLFIKCWFWKMEMIDFYRLLQSRFSDSDLNIESDPIDRDRFPKPEKYRDYYRLLNWWKIKKWYEKYLKNWPLFSENGTRVIVPEAISWKDRWWWGFLWIIWTLTLWIIWNYIYDFLK